MFTKINHEVAASYGLSLMCLSRFWNKKVSFKSQNGKVPWFDVFFLTIEATSSGWWCQPIPLKNMSSSIGMMTLPIYGKIIQSCSKPPTSKKPIFFFPIDIGGVWVCSISNLSLHHKWELLEQQFTPWPAVPELDVPPAVKKTDETNKNSCILWHV